MALEQSAWGRAAIGYGLVVEQGCASWCGAATQLIVRHTVVAAVESNMEMKEFERVRQDKKGYKRFFTDDLFDLYVWYTKKNGSITGFQLVYEKWTNPRAFTWLKDKGYRHDRIDGYDSNRWNLTPILVANGYLDKKSIADKFFEHSKRIDKEIVTLVYRTLVDYDPEKGNQGI